MAFNSTIKDSNLGFNLRPNYTHQPLTFDHYDAHVQIKPNGKVIITMAAKDVAEEFDEVEVSASLIFKIAQQLKLTRSVEFVKKD